MFTSQNVSFAALKKSAKQTNIVAFTDWLPYEEVWWADSACGASQRNVIVPEEAKWLCLAVRDADTGRVGNVEVALPLAPEPPAR